MNKERQEQLNKIIDFHSTPEGMVWMMLVNTKGQKW